MSSKQPWRWPHLIGQGLAVGIWIACASGTPAADVGRATADTTVLIGVASHETLMRPIEETLHLGSVYLVRSVKRRIVGLFHWLRKTLIRSTGWLIRIAVVLLVAVAASVVDRTLWRQWRTQGWSGFRSYLSLAAPVYVLMLFDRHAERTSHVMLAAALIYGIVPSDLIPDTLAGGMVDDVVIVAAASRWFTRRCPAQVIERQVERVQRWRQRTRAIQARRDRISDDGAAKSSER